MTADHLAFALLAANPVGGLLVAVPFGIFALHDPPWLVVTLGAPLAYLQVLVVELGWTALTRWSWWQRLLAKKRGGWSERLLQSKGGFWITFVATPLIGPWLVMALMRFANVPHRRVAIPMGLSLACTASVLCAGCVIAPQLFAR